MLNAGVEWNGSSFYLETLGREEAREKILDYFVSAQHINIFLTSEILHLKEHATLTQRSILLPAVYDADSVSDYRSSNSRMIHE
jgi:hypothetical protein